MGSRRESAWTRFSLALDGLQINDKYSFRKLGLDREIKTKSISVVVDDPEAERVGPWRKSNVRSNHQGKYYLATTKKKCPHEITWKTLLPKPGTYEVRVSFGGGEGLSKAAPYTVSHAKGKTQLIIDQSAKPTIDNLWFPLGRFSFGNERSAAVSAEVSLSDKGTEGYLIADAVQFVHVDDLENKEDLSTYLEESSTAIFRGAYTPYGFDDYSNRSRNYRIHQSKVCDPADGLC